MARPRQRRRLRATAVVEAVLLDSHALGAGAQGDTRVRAELAIAEQLGARVHVSSCRRASCRLEDLRMPSIHVRATPEMAPDPQLTV